jgi:hypothetical protein
MPSTLAETLSMLLFMPYLNSILAELPTSAPFTSRDHGERWMFDEQVSPYEEA